MLWILGAIIALLFVIVVVIYRLPDTPKRSKKEKKVAPPLTSVDDKDWKEIAIRWEKKNNVLLGDVEKLNMHEKKMQKEIDTHKEHIKELMDKMALEKSWREKEEGNLDKAKHHEKDLRDQIKRTEKDLEKEHSARLQLERELQDIKIKLDNLQEEKREATVNAGSLSATVKEMRNQIRDLMKDNEALKQKREDVQWVAKSEYDELLKKYKEKQ